MEHFTLPILHTALRYWKKVCNRECPVEYSGLCSYFHDREGIDYEATINVLEEHDILNSTEKSWLGPPGTAYSRIKALEKLIEIVEEEEKRGDDFIHQK